MRIIFDIIKGVLHAFLSMVKLLYYKSLWKKNNTHNNTYVNSIFDFKKVKVGKYTYGPLNVMCWNDKNEYLSIGSFCSIAPGVTFILGGNHNTNSISSFPFKYFIKNENTEATSKGRIIIEDDVWIGTNATILSGITIGQGCVIAGGAMVTKSFPPYSIIGGNPAKIIRKRFTEEIIEKAVLIDYQKMEYNFLRENINIFEKENVSIEDIEELLKKQ